MTATRITPEDIMNNISSEKYLREGVLTICVLTLKNGFTVTGESACADPANYNQELGERLAKSQAVNKIWPLMGYELRNKLSQDINPPNLLTFLDRLIQEEKELAIKYMKLSLFTTSKTFRDMPGIEQDDLIEQAQAMDKYLTVVRRRIERNSR